MVLFFSRGSPLDLVLDTLPHPYELHCSDGLSCQNKVFPRPCKSSVISPPSPFLISPCTTWIGYTGILWKISPFPPLFFTASTRVPDEASFSGTSSCGLELFIAVFNPVANVSVPEVMCPLGLPFLVPQIFIVYVGDGFSLCWCVLICAHTLQIQFFSVLGPPLQLWSCLQVPPAGPALSPVLIPQSLCIRLAPRPSHRSQTGFFVSCAGNLAHNPTFCWKYVIGITYLHHHPPPVLTLPFFLLRSLTSAFFFVTVSVVGDEFFLEPPWTSPLFCDVGQVAPVLGHPHQCVPLPPVGKGVLNSHFQSFW